MTMTYAAAALSAVALVTGCTQADTGGPLGPDPRATVVVHALVRTGVIFDEGSLPEVRLVAPDGSVVRPRKDYTETAVFPGLSTGSYRLRASLRPCDGNCGYLDPPTFRCSARVDVAGDRAFRVIWTGARRCRVARA